LHLLLLVFVVALIHHKRPIPGILKVQQSSRTTSQRPISLSQQHSDIVAIEIRSDKISDVVIVDINQNHPLRCQINRVGECSIPGSCDVHDAIAMVKSASKR